MNRYDQQHLDDIVEALEKSSDHMKSHNHKSVFLPDLCCDSQFCTVLFSGKNNHKSVFQILIVLDDVAYNPSLTRHEQLLHALYLRCRHSCISTIVSTQVVTALSPIIRQP